MNYGINEHSHSRFPIFVLGPDLRFASSSLTLNLNFAFSRHEARLLRYTKRPGYFWRFQVCSFSAGQRHAHYVFLKLARGGIILAALALQKHDLAGVTEKISPKRLFVHSCLNWSGYLHQIGTTYFGALVIPYSRREYSRVPKGRARETVFQIVSVSTDRTKTHLVKLWPNSTQALVFFCLPPHFENLLGRMSLFSGLST